MNRLQMAECAESLRAGGLALLDLSRSIKRIIDWRPQDHLDESLRALPTSVRNVLTGLGIYTVSALADTTGGELIRQRNFGKKSLAAVQALLGAQGLKLRDQE